MVTTQRFSRRITLPFIVSLVGLGILNACGMSDSTQAPVASVHIQTGTCQVLHSYATGTLNKTDEELFSASESGDVQRIEQSIAAGANVNASGYLNRTPLFAAAFCDQPEVA